MSQKPEKIRVGISIGDIAGIGPEIIMKTFVDERMYRLCTPVVFSSPGVFSFYRKSLDIQKFQFAPIKDTFQLSHHSVNIIPAWEEEVDIVPGKPNEITGHCALRSLDSACQALKNNIIDVLVTAPLNKHAAESGAPGFRGHTEYLQEYFGAEESLMFMVSEQLKIGLATNHLPINEVAAQLTKEKIVAKVRLMFNSLREDFAIEQPRIAILALNPHAGDGGTIGKEDLEIVKPAVDQCADEFTTVFGPYPADAFFTRNNYKSFDGVLAMYHDQGLIPFKALSVGGVNFTAGLPVVRTSPDHGTAEDIAGQNMADPMALQQAIFTAIDIYTNRQHYKEAHARPLKRHLQKLERDR